jgi:hypothetical protein
MGVRVAAVPPIRVVCRNERRLDEEFERELSGMDLSLPEVEGLCGETTRTI